MTDCFRSGYGITSMSLDWQASQHSASHRAKIFSYELTVFGANVSFTYARKESLISSRLWRSRVKGGGWVLPIDSGGSGMLCFSDSTLRALFDTGSSCPIISFPIDKEFLSWNISFTVSCVINQVFRRIEEEMYRFDYSIRADITRLSIRTDTSLCRAARKHFTIISEKYIPVYWHGPRLSLLANWNISYPQMRKQRSMPPFVIWWERPHIIWERNLFFVMSGNSICRRIHYK
jgi:hypothetical protein